MPCMLLSQPLLLEPPLLLPFDPAPPPTEPLAASRPASPIPSVAALAALPNRAALVAAAAPPPIQHAAGAAAMPTLQRPSPSLLPYGKALLPRLIHISAPRALLPCLLRVWAPVPPGW